MATITKTKEIAIKRIQDKITEGENQIRRGGEWGRFYLLAFCWHSPLLSVAKDIARIVGGGGGGKPDIAQAGGQLTDRLDEALKASYKIISEKLY